MSQTDVLSPTREDGNNVNIDAEIADMAKNTIKYRAAVTLMGGQSGSAPLGHRREVTLNGNFLLI